VCGGEGGVWEEAGGCEEGVGATGEGVEGKEVCVGKGCGGNDVCVRSDDVRGSKVGWKAKKRAGIWGGVWARKGWEAGRKKGWSWKACVAPATTSSLLIFRGIICDTLPAGPCSTSLSLNRILILSSSTAAPSPSVPFSAGLSRTGTSPMSESMRYVPPRPRPLPLGLPLALPLPLPLFGVSAGK
jgi:hypothetical protein